MSEKTETKKSDKIQEYIKSKEEIFEFALSRRILKIILFYLSIISVFLFIGGNSYINYVIKSHVNEEFSQRVEEEVDYLTEHNKITETGDRAISTAKIKYYEDLKNYFNKNISERVQIAAKAEILRIESFFREMGDEFFPEDAVEFLDDKGEKTVGVKISTENLMKKFNNTDRFGEKTTILDMLSQRSDENVPEFMLNVAKNTDNLRMRFVALRSFQFMLFISLSNNYFPNTFDCEANEQLWKSEKERYINKIRK